MKNVKPRNAFLSKGLICFSIVFLLLTITGCWDRDEPEKSAFVAAIGFDYHEDRELYEVTIQVPDPNAEAPVGGAGGGEGIPFAVISAMGHTPYEAARNLNLYMTREPFYAHNQIVIFSESVARKGLGPILDFLERDRQPRLTAIPVVLEEGQSITNLLRTDLPLESVTAAGFARHAIQISQSRSVFPSRALVEFFIYEPLPGRDVLIGRVRIGEQTEEDLVGEKEGAVRSNIILEGAAAFSGDKMKGWFDQLATTGWFWIQGRADIGLFNILCPAHDEHPITIEVYQAQSKMEPVVTDEGEYRVRIEIEADIRMENQLCPVGYVSEGELTDSLDRRIATVIKNEAKIAIERAKELEVDVFGFGNLFYRKMPKEWEKIEDRWYEIFAELPVDIEVEANVRRTGVVREPFTQE